MPAAGYYGGPRKHPRWLIYGLAQVHSFIRQRDHGGHAQLAQRLPSRSLAARQQQNWDAHGLRATRHLARRLPVSRLLVDAALDGDLKRGPSNLGVEPGRIDHERRSANEIIFMEDYHSNRHALMH